MIEKEGKKYIEVDKNAYVISLMGANDLYETLCKELSFDKMIKLYKLIKHKMEFLDDEPRMEIACYNLKDSDVK